MTTAPRATRQRRDSLSRKLEAAGLSPEQVRNVTAKRELVTALPVRAPLSGVVVAFPATLGQAVKDWLDKIDETPAARRLGSEGEEIPAEMKQSRGFLLDQPRRHHRGQ